MMPKWANALLFLCIITYQSACLAKIHRRLRAVFVALSDGCFCQRQIAGVRLWALLGGFAALAEDEHDGACRRRKESVAYACCPIVEGNDRRLFREMADDLSVDIEHLLLRRIVRHEVDARAFLARDPAEVAAAALGLAARRAKDDSTCTVSMTLRKLMSLWA